MAGTANGRPSGTPVYIEEPGFSKWLFGSSMAGWIWLVARLWLGWEWLQAGWHKVFGGNITWKVWDWGNRAYSLTGDGNIGWVRSGTVPTEEGRPADPAIRTVGAGQNLLDPAVTNGQIAEQLGLADKTVKNYLSSILAKLEVARRAEAAAYLARHTTTPGSS